MREQPVDFSLPCTPDLAYNPPPPTPGPLQTPAPAPPPSPAPSSTLAPSSCSVDKAGEITESLLSHSWDTDCGSTDPFDEDESLSEKDNTVDVENKRKSQGKESESEQNLNTYKRNAQYSSKSSMTDPSIKSFNLHITKQSSQEDGENDFQIQHRRELISDQIRIKRYEYGKRSKLNKHDNKNAKNEELDINKTNFINNLVLQPERIDCQTYPRTLSASKLLQVKEIEYEKNVANGIKNVSKKENLFGKNSQLSHKKSRSGELSAKKEEQGIPCLVID